MLQIFHWGMVSYELANLIRCDGRHGRSEHDILNRLQGNYPAKVRIEVEEVHPENIMLISSSARGVTEG